jgi:glycosidase
MRKVAILLVAALALVLGVGSSSSAAGSSTVTIHYQPAAGNTDDWNLWLWEPGQNGFSVDFSSTDAFGKVASYTFDHSVTDVGFIVKVGNWVKKDGTIDRSIRNFSNGNAEVWVRGGVVTVYTSNPDAVVPKPVLPTWARSATIYEVNVRQFSAAAYGQKLKAVKAQLPRLKALGVKILWLMPVYSISVEGRKGTLGSPYAVKDYTEVNPEFGTLADLQALVTEAHRQGFHVILDWVANHTGLDAVWTSNPSWYQTVVNGVIQPNSDWTDVADLNFDNADMRAAMISAMKYWVNTVDIDGYRCDFSGGVPVDFWEEATAQLQTIKPLFMLSENDSDYAQLRSAFVANYGWSLLGDMNAFARSGGDAFEFVGAIKHIANDYPSGTFPMTFITNHDENSWNGTEYERLGAYVKRFSALYFTLPGMPLIYNGQEIGLKRRLQFFENDPIIWGSSSMTDFYRKLVSLKTKNVALWNGTSGGAVKQYLGSNDNLLTYTRVKGSSKVVVVINLTAKAQTAVVKLGSVSAGTFYKYSNGAKTKLTASQKFVVPAGGFEIYSTVQTK